jgi:hypothetical protein
LDCRTHCEQNPGDPRCNPGGINIIHNEYYQERGACCVSEANPCIDDLTESFCNTLQITTGWQGPGSECSTAGCPGG